LTLSHAKIYIFTDFELIELENLYVLDQFQGLLNTEPVSGAQ